MNTLKCPHCSANFATQSAADGWCEQSHSTTPTAERFVPDAASPCGGTFIPAPSLGNSRLDAAAVSLPGGSVLVVGGVKREGREEFLASAEVYGR